MQNEESPMSEQVKRRELLADILALDKAIDDFLNDLRTRAGWDKANIDSDGVVSMPVGNGVLYRLGIARENVGRHLPALTRSTGDAS